jgi:hypothetical protein
VSLNIWGYPLNVDYLPGMDLTGFAVEARDGRIGRVDQHDDEVGQGCLLVDVGIWIFGKKVLLPTGAIERIDVDRTTVVVARSKDEIRHAPPYDPAKNSASAPPDPHDPQGAALYEPFTQYHRMSP